MNSEKRPTKLEALNTAFRCAYIECPAYVIDDLKQRFDEYLAEQLAASSRPLEAGTRETLTDEQIAQAEFRETVKQQRQASPKFARFSCREIDGRNWVPLDEVVAEMKSRLSQPLAAPDVTKLAEAVSRIEKWGTELQDPKNPKCDPVCGQHLLACAVLVREALQKLPGTAEGARTCWYGSNQHCPYLGSEATNSANSRGGQHQS
jgi:hypothetical protein